MGPNRAAGSLSLSRLPGSRLLVTCCLLGGLMRKAQVSAIPNTLQGMRVRPHALVTQPGRGELGGPLGQPPSTSVHRPAD